MNDNKTIINFEKNGNLQIEEIILDYNNYIFTILKNANINQEDIEEILSDVFIILWNNYKKLDKTTKIKPYLVGITKNLIKKKYREYNLKFEMKELEYIDNNIISDFDISKLVENQEKSRIIEDVMNHVKKQEQQIFIMFYYQNKKIKEIAKNLNISELKVKVTLHRLRNLVKKNLKERGYSYGK